MIKKVILILILFFGITITVSAKEITLTEDYGDGSVIFVTEDTVINGNGHTIYGSFDFSSVDASLTLNDVILDASNHEVAVLVDSYRNLINLTEVEVKNYSRVGVLFEEMPARVTIMDSTFDSSAVSFINGGAVELNIQKEIYDVGFYGDTIYIANNIFKNCTVKDEDLDNSDAGAIKIRVKDNTNVADLSFQIIIKNNKFINNTRDLVLGTLDVASGMSGKDSLNFYTMVEGSPELVIYNNSIEGKSSDKTYRFNKNILKKGTLGFNLFYSGDFNKYYIEMPAQKYASVVKKEKFLAMTDEERLALINESISYSDNYIILEDLNYNLILPIANISLNDTVVNFAVNVTYNSKNEKLKSFEDGSNLFISSYKDGKLPNKATLEIETGFLPGSSSYLYFYNEETSKLEFVGESVVSDNGFVSYEIDHFSDYVLSNSKELTFDNPKTNVNVEIIISLILVSITFFAIFSTRKI
jgi:hypothetical protein